MNKIIISILFLNSFYLVAMQPTFGGKHEFKKQTLSEQLVWCKNERDSLKLILFDDKSEKQIPMLTQRLKTLEQAALSLQKDLETYQDCIDRQVQIAQVADAAQRMSEKHKNESIEPSQMSSTTIADMAVKRQAEIMFLNTILNRLSH